MASRTGQNGISAEKSESTCRTSTQRRGMTRYMAPVPGLPSLARVDFKSHCISIQSTPGSKTLSQQHNSSALVSQSGVPSSVIACAMNGPRVEDQTAGYRRRKTGRVFPSVPSHQACSPRILSPSSTSSLSAPSADDGVTVCRPDKVQVYQRYGPSSSVSGVQPLAK
jgi:hypothetical protein